MHGFKSSVTPSPGFSESEILHVWVCVCGCLFVILYNWFVLGGYQVFIIFIITIECAGSDNSTDTPWYSSNSVKENGFTPLQVFNLMIPTTDIHDPLPPHPRIKSGSNLDSNCSSGGSPCNFPLKLEQSQQLVIHMHLKSNTLLLCPSVAPPFLTHQWTSTPPMHSDHYAVFPPSLSLTLSCPPPLSLHLHVTQVTLSGSPPQLDSTQGLIW